MPSTVFANSRCIIHQSSGDQHVVFPDVCITPTSPDVPLPYPNVGMSLDGLGGAVTVRVEGAMPMTKSAKYTKTAGDEAGTSGGVLSGAKMGEAEFMLYSFDVKFEGKNVCRIGDSMFHNKKNAAG